MAKFNLALKYRPNRFDEMVGQDVIAHILKAAISTGRLNPAYLFAGPKGTGKTTAARLFSKALTCQARGVAAEPCNKCEDCKMVMASNHPDILELDAASHTQVEKIREAIIDTVPYRPMRGSYRIFILDEAHMLSASSFNALLKTLEEPPSHVIFILATTEVSKIPPTISSRCQRYKFSPIPAKIILFRLEVVCKLEEIKIETDALALIARAAAGSMRDGLMLLDQVVAVSIGSSTGESISKASAAEVIGIVNDDIVLSLVTAVGERNSKSALQHFSEAVKQGVDVSSLLKSLRIAFRDMLSIEIGVMEPGGFSSLPKGQFDRPQLIRATNLLTRCADIMKVNDLPTIVFECFLVQLCEKPVLEDELMRRIELLERSRESSSGPTAPKKETP